MTYRIKDWNEHFEVADSRYRIKTGRRFCWVAMPTRHDGDGFSRVMEAGLDVFGAWCLLVQVAAKMPIRGTLVDNTGQPMTAESLARRGRVPASQQQAIATMLHLAVEIGWLEVLPDTTVDTQVYPVVDTKVYTEVYSPGPRQYNTVQDKTKESANADSCAEPKTASAHAPQAVLLFPCKGTGLREWPLTEAKVNEYRTAYPGVDVVAECRRARQWLLDNPTRGKTARGMMRFLGSWLARTQDRGAPTRAGHADADGQPDWNEITDKLCGTKPAGSSGGGKQ